MSTMLKRLLSLAVALVMVICLMPWNAASVYAAEETTADTSWYDAEQSEFTIDTVAELLGLSELAKENNFAGKTVILGDDISLAGIAWTPIGTSTVAFAGTFDGNDKTISDMSLTTTGNGGFFAYLCGAVKDLTVSGSISSTGGVVGGIAANIKSGASLSNVACNVNITHTAGSNNGGVVGLILEKGNYTIENCSYNGTFTGSKSDNIGGILGNANGKGSTIIITGCSITGSISAKAQVGGLVGNTHNTNTIVVTGCSNDAAVTGTGNNVGGLIGSNGTSSLTIENCQNNGAVTGSKAGAGGILGGFNASGSVTTSDTTNTGTWYNANATAFTISSVDELLQFNELAKTYDFSGKTVNLSTDLDLTSVAWAPIGLHVNAEGIAVGKAFAGTFNGNGNTISGMKAEPSGKAGSWGFFGQIAGTLKNFTVSGSIEGAGSQVGGVTGALRSGANLENVTSDVDITITGNNVGGFAGRVEQAGTYTISGCTFSGTISVTGNAVGGILGNANNKAATFNISNCTIAEGAEISGANQVGGIVGNAHNGNTFTISGTNNANVSGNQQVGGIVGLLGSSTMTVKDSVNNGDIAAVNNGDVDIADGHVAGIVGQMNSGADLTITGCTNNGVIISSGNEFGGIVGTGRSTLTIENTRNNGAVTATQGNDSTYYGAIVGSLYGDSEEKPCVVTFGGEEGVTYLPTCSDQAYSFKVTEEGEAGSFVTVNGECTVYDPNPLGSETNPIVINEATELTSISVEAGKTIYYTINGQLNNCILTIAGQENVVITLNGEEFSETAVLTGTSVNALVITNNSEEAITLVAEISQPVCTEHSWDAGVVTDPTCTEDGYTTYTCSACGQTKIENVVPANGEHSYDDGVVTKEPTCGEDGEMTYTCSVCGHSYTEAIDALTAIAAVNGVNYASLAEAVQNANGSVITLLADATDSITIAADVTIDLAGLTLENVTVTEGYALTLIDTENDDYAGNGYAKVNGTVNTHANVDGKNYIVINNDGQLSAHRYEVVISHISLKPTDDALGYKAQLLGDEAVQAAVTCYGFEMSVSGGKVVTVSKDGTLENGQFTLRLKNIMACNGGELPINAQAFVIFGEQTTKSENQTTTMKETVLMINDLTTLSDAQKTAVGKYYDDHKAVMDAWFAQVETNNIDTWYTEEA